MPKCPVCDEGTVWIDEPYMDRDTGEIQSIMVGYQCSECEGTGIVNERERKSLVREITADADYEEQRLRES